MKRYRLDITKEELAILQEAIRLYKMHGASTPVVTNDQFKEILNMDERLFKIDMKILAEPLKGFKAVWDEAAARRRWETPRIPKFITLNIGG
jgi:hypothetical protein